MSSRKLHPKSRNRPPPLRYLICIFTHSSHSRGQTQTADIQHLGQSSLSKFSQSVQLTSTDLNRNVGSQMVSSGFLPNPIAVNNHQDDQVQIQRAQLVQLGRRPTQSAPLSLLTLCRPIGARRDAHGSQVTQSNLTHHHLHESIH
ncbi:hypothetical protein CHARACLAT_033255 [Characodon lateralis]|uniref:Uncharacterized protein n=1 Tax=Characodon lateralis TaxID=208331 RepID=A0ABU7D2R1_9TELE|nr:hypothetical protein [Characodon lateralis]